MSNRTVRVRLAALAAWRDSVVNSGRNPSTLPSNRDLVTIAQSPEVNRAALSALLFESPSAVFSYAAGILGVLRSALADEQASDSEPQLPAELAALLPAEEGATGGQPPNGAAASTDVGASAAAVTLLGYLLEWRDGVVRSGRNASALPTDRDLVEIARCGVAKRAVIEGLDLDRPAAVKDFGMGIVTAMRTGLAAAEAGSGRPPVADDLMVLVLPVARSTRSTPRYPPPPINEALPNAGDLWGDTVFDDVEAAGTASSRKSGTRERPEVSEEFAQYEPVEQPPAISATCVAGPDAVELSWLEPAPGTHRIYRVVSADGYPPFSPDEGLLIATTDPVAVDPRPILSVVRYYAVWVNEGSDDADARRNQPRLLAVGYVVAPPSGVSITLDNGKVFGQWAVADGVRRVEVQRIPAQLKESGTYLSQYSVARTSDNLKGFSDAEWTPGTDVVYRVFATVESDEGDLLISPPVEESIAFPGVVPVMGEIEAVASADRTTVDLTWAQSMAADVRIYRTDKPPSVGTQREMPAQGLELVLGGPAEGREVKLSPDWSDGTATLAGIPWPPGWTRVYFTAVAFDRDTTHVGPTATLARSGKITDAAVHQRVTWQQLTFNWPLGADEVRVYRTPPGVEQLGDSAGEPFHTVTFEEHRDLGAIRFRGRDRSLWKEGCALHLVPVTYNVTGAVRGDPAIVAYRGLLRVLYVVKDSQPAEPQGRRGLRSGPPATSPSKVVEVMTDWQPPDLEIELTLVANHDRLPLSVRDGTQVASVRVSPPGRSWLTVCEFLRANYDGSLVRLFATNSGASMDIAVLDPKLETLRA